MLYCKLIRLAVLGILWSIYKHRFGFRLLMVISTSKFLIYFIGSNLLPQHLGILQFMAKLILEFQLILKLRSILVLNYIFIFWHVLFLTLKTSTIFVILIFQNLKTFLLSNLRIFNFFMKNALTFWFFWSLYGSSIGFKLIGVVNLFTFYQIIYLKKWNVCLFSAEVYHIFDN